MKLVILVISSNNLPIYTYHQRLWRSYAKSNPNITVYFLHQSEDISAPHLHEDTIWVPGKECLETIFDKTVAAFKLLPANSYDFLVRTNLSSVWNFNTLIEFCKTLPNRNVFCGVLGNPGISGAGMILSPDVVQKFIEHSGGIERCMWDDVDFGRIAVRCGIPSTPGYRCDPRSSEDVERWWNRAYHFYLKDMRTGTRNVENEIKVMEHLVKKIYG